MNSIKTFSEEKLPPKEEFYSKLNDCEVSDEDYNHAQRIWKEFGIKNLGEYHDLYLKSDVLLLADDFEEFRNVCLENYSLDPAWYHTSPGLSWDALLKHSRIGLELLTDSDMLLLFEKGIRRGISMIPNRFGKANNKYMGKKFDPRSPSKFIVYLDANNLYMNGIEKFEETKLPPKEKFFSKLNDCEVSDEDYNHAQRIWKEFRIKNLGEYRDLYLKSDVLLLADVFEEFRNVCLENYSLDPAWYYTSPGLS